MTNQDYQTLTELLKLELKHECRFSDRQVKLLRWDQIGECSVITRTGREVKIKAATYNALLALPRDSRCVFGKISPSPEAPSRQRRWSMPRLRLVYR